MGRPKAQGKKRGSRTSVAASAPPRQLNNVFEADDGNDGAIDKRRYESTATDVYEYEVPDDFEDEEINSDEAFNAEDRVKFAHLFGHDSKERERAEAHGYADHDDGDDDGDDAQGERPELEEHLFAFESASEGPADDVDDDGDDGDEDDNDDGGDDGVDREDLKAKKGLLSDLSSFAGPARGKLRVRGEPAAESEFNMIAAAEGDQVSLAMVASSLDGQQPQTKKAVERLARTGPTAAAIGTETASRLERDAAYGKASRHVSRWNAPVVANREKRTLRLGDDPNYKATLPTIATLSATFEPETDLEKAVAANLLQESKVKQYEDLAARALTVDEVLARNAQLAKMRSLMYFDELKARRRKLIKSKKYRKILKRQKEKTAPSLDELKVLDADAARDEAMRLEKARALERVTQRHRNTGTWIKGALRKAGHKEGTREAIREQLRVGDELRRKMDVNSSESDGDDGDDDGDHGDGKADGAKDAPLSPLSSSSVEVSSVEMSDSDDDGNANAMTGNAHDDHNDHADEPRTAGGAPLPQLNPRALESALLSAPRSHAVASSAALTAQLVEERVKSLSQPAPVVDYAGDAVWQFEDDRKKLEPVVEEPKEESIWEMGWGSWTGEGTKPVAPKKAPTKKRKKGPTQRDYSETVIKTEEKAPEKYSVAKVPFPYTSAEQYEADLALPVGKEWNAQLAFDALKMPSVIVRSGVYLEPIKHQMGDDDRDEPSKTKGAKSAGGKKKAGKRERPPKRVPKNIA